MKRYGNRNRRDMGDVIDERNELLRKLRSIGKELGVLEWRSERKIIEAIKRLKGEEYEEEIG